MMHKIITVVAVVALTGNSLSFTQFKSSASSPMHLEHIHREFERDKHEAWRTERKEQLKHYYLSGSYEAEVEARCDEAFDFFCKQTVTDKSLIIFDIDDTAVYSWWQHEPAEFIWSEHGLLMQARNENTSPAISAVKRLYDLLRAQGYTIIFMTGRDEAKRDMTLKSLHALGYHGYADIYFLPNERAWCTNQELAEWKLSMRQQLAQHYDIVGSIADRELDFYGGCHGYKVKLPNYIY